MNAMVTVPCKLSAALLVGALASLAAGCAESTVETGDGPLPVDAAPIDGARGDGRTPADAATDGAEAFPLESWQVTITPNWVSPNDDITANYNSVWVYGASPTTPYRGPDSQHQQTRYLLLDPRYLDSDGRVGNDDWWFIVERSWPAAFDPANHGAWGREVNFHNVAGDAGPGGGVGWGFGDGVSSLALDWSGGTAPVITIEPEASDTAAHTHALPPPARDQFHTYVLHFIAGRTDGTTVHQGALTVWADGEDTPVIDLANIDTVQRAQGPDGNWYVQRWMVLWEGDYTANIPVAATMQLGLTRIGRTYAEAVGDQPHAVGDDAGGQYYRGSGTNLGAPSAVQLPSRSSSDSRLPPSLR